MADIYSIVCSAPFPTICLPTTHAPGHHPHGAYEVLPLTGYSLLIFISSLGFLELRWREGKLFPDSVRYPRNFLLLLKQVQITFLMFTVKKKSPFFSHLHSHPPLLTSFPSGSLYTVVCVYALYIYVFFG